MKPVLAIAKLLIKEIFRKKDFYVAFILMGVILVYASRMNFYNVNNISRYLLEIGLFLVFLFSIILTLALAARQYSSEIQNRTCAVLMSKPITRFHFVAGKFLGSFFAGLSVFIIFYGLFLAVAGQKSASLSWSIVLQAGYLFILSLFVMTAMASGLSYYLTTSANVSICLVLYLLMMTYGASLKEVTQHLNVVSSTIGKIFYYALPHLEFFDLRQRLIHGWPPVSMAILIFLTAYALICASAFLILGALRFSRARL